MDTLYNRIIDLCKKRGIKGGRLCTDIGISKGTLTDLKMGRQTGLSAVTAQKIANYFGVTVGYLLGDEENKKAPTATGGHSVSDDDIKFALFRGREDITDAMYEEVLNFAEYVAHREEDKGKKAHHFIRPSVERTDGGYPRVAEPIMFPSVKKKTDDD